jgi:sugar O-acyltransferase (sialic acid O-acetyltransferase NeuD family)
MEKLIVIGGGGHSKVVISILKKLNRYEIMGYTDIEDKGSILGIPYMGNDERLKELYVKENVKNAVIAVGQITNVNKRIEIGRRLKSIGFSLPSIVSPHAILSEDVIVSEGAVIMNGTVINPGTTIGAYSIINTMASIDHDCNIGNFVHIAPGVTLSGSVKVGNNVLIGTGAVVIHNKTIVEDCIVGAGAVVVVDCLEPGIYVGNPAGRIKK